MAKFRYNPTKDKKKPILNVGILKRLEEYEDEEETEEELIKKLDEYIDNM